MTGVISSNFGSVEEGAQQVLATARQVNAQLEDFHKFVTNFVAENWTGDAEAAFTQMQAQWNTNSQQLSATLEKAAQTVSAGNDELRATDIGAAAKFG
ncbi:hypothetical protein BOX37_04185 [Nocardia mangyaensis]|uniref:ESAT-6-like protein n=1 Tax=Nocardia mangyaensis TaxID=2213200 RepID=A0A1J0VMR0_9NOCA|nr:WXG100 family type VII secretion target [Nocardia mangyaensis]APE33298.1 hypothetical protein BOX37_04185 [Nocardia mangyaensis]MDO3647250.1 WXG100 family type VII secretion target [Nocardia mangyaensis]